MCKQAGIVIIGNEILSGKTTDSNTPYLTQELRKLGVEVREICTIPDEASRIAEVVADFSRRFSYVFTSGGVGPTHDDVTMQGIALAFQKKVVRHPQLVEILKGWYKNEATETRLKMAEIPEGSELHGLEKLPFPAIVFQNIFILPGIPKILQEKFEAIKENFRDTPFFLKNIYVKTPESSLAAYLNQLLREYPELLVGSYPELDNPVYRVKVTVESKDHQYLEKALQRFLAHLPSDAVVKVEP